MRLKIKICGLREPANITEVAALQPDLMGFIFYPPSPRYAGLTLTAETLHNISSSIIKTGVFVDEDFDAIIRITEKFNLNCVQLHGNETPDLCRRLKENGLRVIKSFSMKKNHNFIPCKDYINHTDYFLFDTSGSGFGGSGLKFAWEILNNYNLGHPFFLSGGIGAEDMDKIAEITNHEFYGIDLNSRFESEPGKKETEILRKFISDIRQTNSNLNE